jgi:DNA-binding LacI/PurR family transcriptional regulator
MMAFGAKKAVEERGLRIPEDISLIGYDDLVFSSIVGLTTVVQPTYQMGRNAMIVLLDLINRRIAPPHHIVLKPSLAIRSTCRSPG